MFKSKQDIFSNATPTLGSKLKEFVSTPKVHPHPRTSVSEESDNQTLQFNVDVARAILLMCALIYERDTNFVNKAADASNNASGSKAEPDEATIFLLKSEEHIHRVAHDWKLGYISVAGTSLMISYPFTPSKLFTDVSLSRDA